MKSTDLISIRDLEKSDIEDIFATADAMQGTLESGKKPLHNSVVATMFFEPSTRTRFSFQAAASRLGADVMNFEGGGMTSMAKGETFTDTIRTIDGYADIIVIRHPLEGSARLAADVAEHPVVNAGDGGNQHPTQTLLDLYTIMQLKGRIRGVSVFLVGDLKYARTMRSLLFGLCMFGADVKLISPEGLEMEQGVVSEVKERFSANVEETNKISLVGADIVYVCRIQKERFADQYEAQKLQKQFRITKELLEGVKKDMAILHPLPKVDEIDPAIDGTGHAKYFDQMKQGIPIRMAVIMKLLGKA